MNVPAVNDLQQKLSAVMEELDHKVFRPQQVRDPYVESDRVSSSFLPRSPCRQLLRPLSSLTTDSTHHTSPYQKAAFLCQAKCTDMKGPQEEMHMCLQKCGEPIAKHEASVMGELQQFQNRVQRCVVQCQDKQAGTNTPDTKKYEKCVGECAVFYQKELAAMKPKLMKNP